MTEESFLRIFSYFGNDDWNNVIQNIRDPGNILRVLSANKTPPVVKQDCSTFKEFQDRYIRKNPVALKDSTIGLAFRGQASAAWPLESSLFRRWTNPEMPDNCGTSRKLDIFIDLIQKLAEKHLNPNGQNLRADYGYLMAVLQHYNRTSPLLDWTLNVNYALYFAFADAPADKSEKAAIYIADIGKVNNLALCTVNPPGMNNNNFEKMPVLTLDAVRHGGEYGGGWAFLRPNQFGDIRFALQDGVFAWQNDPVDLETYLLNYNTFMDGTNCAAPGTLWMVTLPVSERPAVMDYLAKNHITHEKLFAGWDEIGRDIVSKYIDIIIKDPSGSSSATVELIRKYNPRR